MSIGFAKNYGLVCAAIGQTFRPASGEDTVLPCGVFATENFSAGFAQIG
jgi:hypothetical protein